MEEKAEDSKVAGGVGSKSSFPSRGARTLKDSFTPESEALRILRGPDRESI